LNGDGQLDKWEEMYNVALLEEEEEDNDLDNDGDETSWEEMYDVSLKEEDNDLDNDGDETSWEEMYDVSLKEETVTHQYETLIESGDAFGTKPVLSFYQQSVLLQLKNIEKQI